MSGFSVLMEGGAPARQDGPLVTVAVSVFDYADEVELALESARLQTHPRLELIVVDDASRDRSPQVVRAWMEARGDRFERTLLLRQDRNRGLSAARNLAFAQARSDHVMVLDADNRLLPRAVARLLESLQGTDMACAYSQLAYFGAVTGVGVADVWRPDGFLHDNYIDAMALVSRAAWAQVGGYSDIDYGWEDYDFWCKFVEAGLRGLYVPEILCRYHVRMDSMARTDTTEERRRLVHGMLARHPWLRLEI